MKAAKPIILSLLMLFCCGIQVCFSQSHAVIPTLKNSVIDLGQQRFADKVALDGQWDFYWNQYLNPADKSIHKDGIPVAFPFRWNGFELNGNKLPSFGYATYCVTVILPKKRQELSMSMPDTYSAYRLYINGALYASNGIISTSKVGFVPHWQYRSVVLPSGVDTLHITLQIANFVHSKGGIGKSLFIGWRDTIASARQRAEAIDLLLTGCLLMGGLFFFGLYLLGNRDKATLLFSMYSIVFSYRIIGTDNYVLHTIFPHISWYITTRLEYFTLFSGIGLFGLYTRYIYPKDTNKIMVLGINFCCLLFALATLFLSPYYFTQLINPFLVVMLFCLIYIPYVYTQAYRKGRPGSIYALMSSVSLMFVFAISLFHYWGLIPPLQLASFLGYLGFFFLQSLVLSHRVSFELKKARHDAEQGLIAKSEFLSTMSHEIRTPLNSVIGMGHLLLGSNPREDQIEQLDVMLFSANNLLSIVNDVLDYNKIEAGKIQFEHIEMDIAAIARNIVTGLKKSAQDKGIGLRLQVDHSLKNKVMGDPTRLTQVMTNLVHNAIKFTKVGYVQLVIDVKEQSDSNIVLHIQVKDTGIGIPQDKQKLIFERFTQADSSTSRGFGGTGLGLAICRRILELQQVELKVSSEEGKGASFYFDQTFEKSMQAPDQQSIEVLPNQADKPLADVAILLVEDNPMNVLVAQTYLKRWGAHIDVATNGQEALDKLDITRHRIVLMDLHMPVMDGYESAKQMRINGITIPIIALTANTPNEVEAQARQTGIDAVIVKPFLPDELYKTVLHYVFKHQKA